MPRIKDYTEDASPARLSYLVIERNGANFRVPAYSSNYVITEKYQVPEQQEFLGAASAQLAPFVVTAVGAGTFAALVTENNHPGIWRIASAAGANTGSSVGNFGGSSVLIGGGEVCEFVLRWPTTTNVVSRAGFYDENTYAADPTDGAWINVAGTTLTGKTANNAAVSTTGTSYTISANTWYFCKIVVNSDATRVDFYVYSAAGALLWTDGLTTNIPTATGRECDFRTGAIKTTATGANIEDVDFMAYRNSKGLTR